jgi:hypothetical protein
VRGGNTVSKTFQSLVNGSLLDSISGVAGTLTAGVSRGFIQTEKGLALEGDGNATLIDTGISSSDIVGDDCSLVCTFMIYTISGDKYLMMSQRSTGSTFMSLVVAGSTLRLYYADDSAAVDTTSVFYSLSITPFVWYNVIATRENSTNVKLYVNAVLEDSATNGGQSPSSDNLSLSAIPAGSSPNNGLLKDTKTFDHVLSVKERNNEFIDFLTAGNSFAQKRGFFVQKPTDLSRHVDDTVGDNLVSTLTNGTTYPFDTFTSSGSSITSAIVASAFGGCRGDVMSVNDGEKYHVSFTYTKNSGNDLRVAISSDLTGASGIISDTLLVSASGIVSHTFTVDTTDSTAYLQLGTSNAGHSIDFSTSEISITKITGLVAAYNMTLDNEGKVTDLTGNGNDGTNVGALPSNDGLEFDGSISYVGCTNNQGLGFTTKLTIATRFKLESIGADKVICAIYDSVTDNRTFYLGYDDGELGLDLRISGDGTAGGLRHNSFSFSNISEVFDLVATYDAGTVKMYLNGVEQSVTSDADQPTSLHVTSNILTLGAIGTVVAQSILWDGGIRDVKLYNRVWSAQEAIDYHNSFILPTLVETFDEGADGIAKLPRDWHKGTGTYKIDQWNVALGTQLSSWSNSDFDTFTSSGAEITSMVSGGTGQNCYGGNVPVGKRYRVTFTSSQALANCDFRVDSNSGLSSSEKQTIVSGLAEGVNTATFVALLSVNRLGFYANGAFSDTQITNFTVVEIPYENDGSGIYYEPIKHGDKYLECTVAGTIATLSGQAYGTWGWDMLKGGAGNFANVDFMSDVVDVYPNINSWNLIFFNDEKVKFRQLISTSVDDLFATSASYINNNQWYHIKITRTKAGVWTVWIDGVLVVADTGSNPGTDTDFPTSVFTVLDLDAGDRVANFHYTDEIRQ